MAVCICKELRHVYKDMLRQGKHVKVFGYMITTMFIALNLIVYHLYKVKVKTTIICENIHLSI